jgi:hypothetical protein
LNSEPKNAGRNIQTAICRILRLQIDRKTNGFAMSQHPVLPVRLEAVWNQQHNPEDTIRRLLVLMKQMSENEFRDKLFVEISALDCIADVLRQALNVMH